jgi:hypothetical protein
MSDNTSVLFVFALIVVLSLYYASCNTAVHNKGSLQLRSKTCQNNNNQYNNSMDSNDSNVSDVSDASGASDVISEYSVDDVDDNIDPKSYTKNTHVTKAEAMMDDSVDSSLEIIKERAMGQNNLYYKRKCRLGTGNCYKHDSYIDSGADKSFKKIDKYFKISPLSVKENHNSRFIPVDESDNQGAPINITNNKGTEKEKYDINGYLPQEKEKDWFETIEPVNVKQAHLINIYKPIGANTIGSTHKNATYDLRGTDKAVCPKFVVSPWLQSSIEPDRSMKSLC